MTPAAAALGSAARLIAPYLVGPEGDELALTLTDGSTPGTGPPGAGVTTRAELAFALLALAVGIPDQAEQLSAFAATVAAAPPLVGVWGLAALDGRFELLPVDPAAPAPAAG